MHRPVKYERGNFHLTITHPHSDPDRLINTVTPIAQVSHFGDITSNQGRNINQAIRALYVGGVRYTIAQWMVASDIDNEEAIENIGGLIGSVSTKVLLTSDINVTDPTLGQDTPQAIESNFFTNTLPVAQTAEIQDTEGLFPRRIHWQNYKSFNLWPANQYTVSNEGTDIIPYAQQQVPVVSTHSSANRKLKLRLEDDESLSFFCTSFLDINSFIVSPEVVFRITGTIWYRFQF